MADLTLTCTNCGRSFVWSASQQAEFARKNWSQPKRCRACREERRAGNVSRWIRQRNESANAHVVWGELVYIGVIALTVVIFFLGGVSWLWAYLAAVNVIVFFCYGYDKLASKIFPGHRIPNDVLILASMALAIVGAELGRRVFHHKTIDPKFTSKYNGCLLIEYFAILLVFLVTAPTILEWLRMR